MVDFVREVCHHFGHGAPSWGVGASSEGEPECHVRSVVDDGDGLMGGLCTMCESMVGIAEIVLRDQYPMTWMVMAE
jgi:hypothetical protein